MIAFHVGLVGPAEAAGISVPVNLETYDPNEYPKWHVFCNMQLGRRLPNPQDLWENPRVIAALTDEEVKVVTSVKLEEKGYV